MSHFIVKHGKLYQYPRHLVEGRCYKRITEWGIEIGQARVFNTRAAAANSSKGQGVICEVLLIETPT